MWPSYSHKRPPNDTGTLCLRGGTLDRSLQSLGDAIPLVHLQILQCCQGQSLPTSNHLLSRFEFNGASELVKLPTVVEKDFCSSFRWRGDLQQLRLNGWFETPPEILFQIGHILNTSPEILSFVKIKIKDLTKRANSFNRAKETSIFSRSSSKMYVSLRFTQVIRTFLHLRKKFTRVHTYCSETDAGAI